MFVPRAAQIYCRREEPVGIDVEEAKQVVAKRNQLITRKVITEDLLKKPKSKSKSKTRIAKEHELEMRIESMRPFLDEWNKWREFYMDANNYWTPKNSGQMTMIENIIELAKKNEIEVEMLVACSFKAYERRGSSPPLNIVLSYGLEIYEEHIENVLLDIDEHIDRLEAIGG